MEDRNLLHHLVIGLKGIAMGAADVVPGVSGGTIAFISGIYEELITSINAINLSLIRTWRKEGFKAFWRKVNGNFLLALFSGIAFSVITLAKLISWLLINEPVLLWSFFFGLVIASIFFVAKAIEKWSLGSFIMLAVGTGIAYYITQLPPVENTAYLPYLFLSGALAVCAMILPGISGAFILVLLGSYKTILDAVHERDLTIVATVGFGAVFGPAVLATLYCKNLNWKSVFTGMVTGIIVLLTWKHLGYGAYLYELLPGFVANGVGILVGEKLLFSTKIQGKKEFI